MGITISYKGSLNDLSKINALTAYIRDICQIMKWEYSELDDDWNASVDATLEVSGNRSEIIGNLGLKGIGFQPHQDCEWVNVFFDNRGIICTPFLKAMELKYPHDPDIKNLNWVKTQFAPINTHIAIIKLFRYLKNDYITDLQVIDDGEYWETEDYGKLEANKNIISKAIDILEKKLVNLASTPANLLKPEEFADYISSIIEDVFKGTIPGAGEQG